MVEGQCADVSTAFTRFPGGDTGPGCQVEELKHTEDWGFCGLPLAVYANNLRECCEAAQRFNDPENKRINRVAIGFTFQLVYNYCFLRDKYVVFAYAYAYG